jgi:L,D-peptidoglycan transpeptidase YkuD (ErfK/YbiS/YcfS/YnhG family)
MSRRKRWLIGTSVTIPILLAGAWVLALQQRTPPLAAFQGALTSIGRARKAGAEQHARKLLNEAEQLLRLGEFALKEQNASLWPFESYRHVDSLFRLSAQRANQAQQESLARRESQKHGVRTTFSAVELDYSNWRNRLRDGLAPMDCQRLLTAAGTNLDLARDLLIRQHHAEAESLLQKTNSLLTELDKRYGSYRNQSAARLEHWRANVRETKEHSRATGQAAIIVDKTAHKLHLVQNGRVTRTYPCDLGYSSASEKQLSGDGATPEGMYKVTEVRQRSQYYKALLLNYPNNSDRERFKQNQREGNIPRRARIGGLIEIHGDGGLGKDWTEGCVAVSNTQMDELMRHAFKGMWVTIVRMTEPAP